MRACAAVWCAALLATAACAAAYTVDCNHEYADCDNELNKQTSDEYDAQTTPMSSSSITPSTPDSLSIAQLDISTEPSMTDFDLTTTENNKKLTIDDLKALASMIHNKSLHIFKAKSLDLSDVTLDSDEDKVEVKEEKEMPTSTDKSEELDGTCKVDGNVYKMGEKIERDCDETCECVPGGTFHCTPRCKHPYIRRGRKLDDPLCFESPVDDCCSIIACSTGNTGESGQNAHGKMDGCRYGKDTYPVGAMWHVGCEQTCTCEGDNVVTCKPRCAALPPSDKCINVQDPHDACCEVQVCDVSQDAHEQPENLTSTTAKPVVDKYQALDNSQEDDSTKARDVLPRSTMRPLVLAEPIGSVKVLSNNTVQVNLIHQNNTEDPIHLLLSSDGGKSFQDVDLKYSNLILNLEGGKDYVLKTRETGTKFNFTISASYEDEKKVVSEEIQERTTSTLGCHEDGKFYAVGEEFHIGCTELCECTGPEIRECAALHCPNHVGLELVSRGCVQWATGPPPEPPNCCPRTARCLSDGSCNYSGHTVPNWSEVPVSLTGCDQRCFCENGELDCQEVCTPLPALPPQSLRCPPSFRPAPVNISDDDCCKHWGCVSNAGYLWKTPGPDQIKLRIPQNFAAIQPISKFTTEPSMHKQTDSYKINRPIPGIITTENPLNITIDPSSELNELKKFPIHIILPEPTIKIDSPPFMPISATSSGILYKIPMTPYHYSIANFSNPNDVIISSTQAPEWPAKNDQYSQFLPKLNEINYFRPNMYEQQQEDVLDPVTSNPNPKPKPKPKYFIPDKYFQVMPKRIYNKIITNTRPTIITNFREKFSDYPNPYLSLLKVPDDTVEIARIYHGPKRDPNKSYSFLDFDRVMKRDDYKNRRTLDPNLEAYQDIEMEDKASLNPEFTKKPQHPAFLPTIPPEIIQYPTIPQEDIQDYDQNNIHRPERIEIPNIKIPNQVPGAPPKYGDDNKKLSVISLVADSPTSIKMLFGLPGVLVGLRGSVDLRYTEDPNIDVSRWHSQVFAPTDEILSTSRLEFRLTGLKPSTTYRVRGKLYLHNLPVEPESDILTVTTLDLPTMEEKRREINSQLTVMDVNDTAAHIIWRHFTEDELPLIDGIQIRYRPVGTPIYLMTELLHHSRSTVDLHDLRPGSRYEASLVIVPPPKALTELFDPTSIEFTTSPYLDPYNWSVQLEARSIGSEAAELTWRGVPPPPERWVRVYRAAHACGDGRAEEHDFFRLAVREQLPSITLTGLKPNTRCRVWLELFLTNGKVKTSNVLEVNTKSQEEPIDNEIESASAIGSRESRGDYYGALVVVGVIAALGAVTSMLLLLIVVRRHRPRSVPITPVPTAPRESSLPPYDNPAYKLELQQETMDL